MKARLEDFLGSRLFLILAVAIYVVLWGILVPFFRHQINPDGVSYISIARKYAAGDLRYAVAGHWAPMISWLLVPWVLLGGEGLLGVRILLGVTGAVCMVGVAVLCRTLRLGKGIRGLVTVSTIPLILFFSLDLATPDLLVTTFLVLYCSTALGEDYLVGRLKGVLCGVMGGLAYLAKTYAFPFFLAHFTLFNLVLLVTRRDRASRKAVALRYLAGMGAFLVVSGPWVGILSAKYGRFTFGTAGDFALAVFSEGSQGYPMEYRGLLEPPDPKAISWWDNPSVGEPPARRVPSAGGGLGYRLRRIADNVRVAYWKFNDESLLYVPALAGAAVLCLGSWRKRNERRDLWFLLATIALYTSGFLPMLVETRFLWFSILLSLVLGASLLERLLEALHAGTGQRALAGAAVILLVACTPVMQLVQNWNTGKQYYEGGRLLAEKAGVGGSIASHGKWEPTLFIAYHLGARYYGATGTGAWSKDLEEDLRRHHIDYYVVWSEKADSSWLPSGHQEVSAGAVPGLSVYDVRASNETPESAPRQSSESGAVDPPASGRGALGSASNG